MFRFENPTYLYALTVVPLLLLLFVFSMLRARRRLRRFADADMLPSLAPLRSEKRLFAKWIISLLALSLLIVMWARPQFGLGEQSKTTTGIEAVICMDVSNSMAATDVQPSRLERAKLLVSSLIFYSWGGPRYLVLLMGNTLASWGFALLIEVAMHQEHDVAAKAEVANPRIVLVLRHALNLSFVLLPVVGEEYRCANFHHSSFLHYSVIRWPM